jgi:hypothetical protein
VAPRLLDVRPERWHLDPLGSLRIGVGLFRKCGPAAFTLGWIEIHDIVDLVRGDELAA